MAYQVILNGETVAADIVARRPQLALKIRDVIYHVGHAHCPPAGAFTLVVDGEILNGWRYATADEVYIRLDGETFIVGLPQSSGGTGAGGQNDNDIRAEMPGTVVSLHCAEGDAVAAGQKLVTVESMKLQIGLVAPRDGIIAKVHVAPNSTFDRGAVLVSLAPEAK